jgi:hypothetical protein
MIREKNISKLIDRKIRQTLTGKIFNEGSVSAIARRVALEVMEPAVYYVQTTNATPAVITVIELTDYSGGWIELVVLGIESDGSTLYTVKYYIRYHRTTTLAIVYEHDWIEDDFPGPFVLVQDDGSENIEIEVTGLAATTIDWECHIITHRKINATAVP